MSSQYDWKKGENGSFSNWNNKEGWVSSKDNDRGKERWGTSTGWKHDDWNDKNDYSDAIEKSSGRWESWNKWDSGKSENKKSYSDDRSWSSWDKNVSSNRDWNGSRYTGKWDDGNWNRGSYGSQQRWSSGKSGFSGGSWSQGRSGPPELWPVDFSNVELVSFVKDFYVPCASVKRRSEEECGRIRREHGITIVSGEDVPKVIVSFDESSFPDYLIRSLYRQFGNGARPTPIQMQGIPIALSGRSVVGIAQTGSGKTLAYILPAVVHINAQQPAAPGEGPIALVLVPTRELCMQIAEEAAKFSKSVIEVGGVPTKIACAFGGVKKSEQLWALKDSLDILVAAPGRLMDFLSCGQTSLKRTTYLVLDEADQMFDMGFEPQLRQILTQIRPDRQTLMWSATWPKEVRNLARNICVDNPVHVQIGNVDEIAANHQIQQVILQIAHPNEKLRKLFDEVLPQLYFDGNGNRIHDETKMLIFCNTKDTVDELTRRMRQEGVPAVAIHSGKEQTERLWVFDQFRNGETKVLVSTNLMGRGVDVPKVNIVLNYDMPTNISEYIHRIGRTARAGAVGKAITFFGRSDLPVLRDLMGVLNEANQDVPDWLDQFHKDPLYRKL